MISIVIKPYGSILLKLTFKKRPIINDIYKNCKKRKIRNPALAPQKADKQESNHSNEFRRSKPGSKTKNSIKESFIASPHSFQPVKPVALIKDLAISRNTI